MTRLSENKLILVTRKTRLDGLIERFNTEAQAKFYIEHSGQDYSDYKKEHQNYYQALLECSAVLSKLGKLQKIDRKFLPSFIFGPNDIVFALGQDGLIANTLKYLNGQPLVGINPDPERWDGILLPFKFTDLQKIGLEIIEGRRPHRTITMGMASLNNGESLVAVNDFFIGPKSHTSAHYIIEYSGKAEEHSSSGIIVSTGMGSTGWLKSILAGATGISSEISGRKLQAKLSEEYTWESDYLYFTVREPFPSTSSQAGIVFGKISKQKQLKLISRMANNGVIFSDGIENDYLEFNSGVEADIRIAEKQGILIQ